MRPVQIPCRFFRQVIDSAYLCRTRIDNIKILCCLFIYIYDIFVILSGVWRVLGAKRSRRTCGFSAKPDNIACYKSRPLQAESMSTRPSCLINNPKPETPRMRPAINAGLRSLAEAEKAYMRQLGSAEIPTRVVILSGVWRVLGAKRSRRTCGFSAKSDNIPWDNSRPVEGREHVNKARQLLAKSLRGGCPTCTASCAVKVGYFVSIVFLESR